VQVAISTCRRHPQYVHGTLESMYAADPTANELTVRLVVCDSDASYVDSWSGMPQVRVEPLSHREHATIASLSPHARCTYNFTRLLEGVGDVIALQDDLQFTENWLRAVTRCIERVERRHGQRFVLALYASYRFKATPFAPYKKWHFYGNQALYFPDGVRRELSAYMYDHAEQGGPDDMMLKDFLCASDIKLFSMNPNVVQHVGGESAIEQRFHKSPSYKPRGQRC